MLKPGIYNCNMECCGWFQGHISLRVKETKTAFRLALMENTCKWDAPQIDDMFSHSKTVTINKSGSKHALNVVGDNWFCLYPYRAGVPYTFTKE